MKSLSLFAFILLFFLVGCSTQKNITKENMDNREAVMAFYNKALTVNKETRPTQILTPILADGYMSTSSSGAKNSEQLMKQLEFFWKLIPDLKWEPQAVYNDGDTYIIRSLASGTPNGDFMGIPTDGTRKFEIMTIDIHKTKDGQILKTNHVEDWATSMQQLKPRALNKTAMEIANEFMGAMGKGDMEAMQNLMHDDMVWQNAGDSKIPWINKNGLWKGKKVILKEFMPSFGAGFKTIKWNPVDAVTSDDTAAYFGQMIGELTNTGEQTKEFTYALRVKVKNGKIILWNWFEDSIEVARAFNKK